MSGVQARNPLVDGWNRHGDEAFNGDTGRAGHNDGVCADSPMSETSARGHCGAGIENDFPATGLADEEGLRAAHPRYPVARAAAGSNVRVFGVQPDDGNDLLVPITGGFNRDEGGVSVKDLVDTTEMYLRTIYDLEEEGVRPLRARIAERLEQSGPTVSQTVARMERDGLLLVAFDRHLKLTEKGRELAVSVMRKHRLAERLLVDVIGLEWEKVHAEACRWEHVMSEKVERRLVKVLNNPTTSPYGNPIPGLGLLGLDRPISDPETLIRLTDVPPGRPTAVVVRRLAEHVQSDPDVIGRLRALGIVPDAHVTVETRRGSVTITVSGHGGFDLTEEMAHAVQVKQVQA